MNPALDLSDESQVFIVVAFASKQAEAGIPVAEVVRRIGISEQTFGGIIVRAALTHPLAS